MREAGAAYVLSARLVTPDSGRVLAAFRETAADSTELIGAIDRLSHEIRATVGESLRSVRAAAPLERVTTSSLPALRLYTRGRYEDAVALDSTFAMAWRKLGVIMGNSDVLRSLQIEACARAYELRDRLGARERALAEGSYHMDVTGNLAAAERALHTLLASYPDDHIAHNNLGFILWLRGMHEAAQQEYRKAREILPISVYFSNLAWAQLGAGEPRQALATLDSAEAAFPDASGPLGQRAELLVLMGRYAEADSLAAELRARWGERSVPNWSALAVEAEADAVRGRLDAALERLERRRRLGRNSSYERYLRPEEIEMAATGARWAAGIAGDRARARTVIEDALDRVPLGSLEPGRWGCGLEMYQAPAWNDPPCRPTLGGALGGLRSHDRAPC